MDLSPSGTADPGEFLPARPVAEPANGVDEAAIVRRTLHQFNARPSKYEGIRQGDVPGSRPRASVGKKAWVGDGMTMRFDPDRIAEQAVGATDGALRDARWPRVESEEFGLLSEVLTLYHAKRALRRIAEANGFHAFALLALKTGSGLLVPEMITSSWPADPSEALGSLGEAQSDLKARLGGDVLPFHLTGPNAALLAAPGEAILCLPLFSDRGRGMLLFALEAARSDGAYGELHLYALYLFARLAALSKSRAPTATLAPREIECLRWSAAGKTSCEIAGILGVSENTVNSYLSAAAAKMNAVNRVQTVAQAIRLGLLA